MMLAAAVNSASLDAVIPDKLEAAKGVLIFDSETDAPPRYAEEDIAVAMDTAGCEALLCGDIYDAPLFEKIAEFGISRFYAAGKTVRQAVAGLDENELPIITDYVGGTGCSGHEDGEGERECNCGEDHSH